MAWGQLPGDEAKTGLAKIYPNANAPTPNADIAERIQQGAKEAAAHAAKCKDHVKHIDNCYDYETGVLECDC